MDLALALPCHHSPHGVLRIAAPKDSHVLLNNSSGSPSLPLSPRRLVPDQYTTRSLVLLPNNPFAPSAPPFHCLSDTTKTSNRLALCTLQSAPQADSPLNCDAGNMLRAGDTIAYESMAKMYTIDLAMQPSPSNQAKKYR